MLPGGFVCNKTHIELEDMLIIIIIIKEFIDIGI